jgi:hypothetical protein
MKTLSIAGTAAMLLVGGGILAHGIGPVHHVAEVLGQGALGWLWGSLIDAGTGVLAGSLLLGTVTLFQRVRAGASGSAGG